MAAKVFWITGLSGAGKTTLAHALVQALRQRQLPVEHLDGDELRKLFPQTGFSQTERDAHILRVGYMASRLESHNIYVVASLISPYRKSRTIVRSYCRDFIEVYLSTPIEVCEARDVKGLYRKARSGEIECFTGISDPYEMPENPEVSIDTSVISTEQAVKVLLPWVD